jgi:ethanolamine kinase
MKYIINIKKDIICKFTLCSHLLWGTWSIVQAENSSIDFDYLTYAKKRFNAFFIQKNEFFLI